MSKKKTCEACAAPKGSVGGQALIEGVMMRGPKGTAMALRLPDGSIETSLRPTVLWKDKYPILGKPFLRGPVTFVESMILGYRCLMESAEKTSLDMNVGEDEQLSKLDQWLLDHFGPKMMTVIGIISAAVGFALSFFLFLWLPSAAFDGVNKLADGAIPTAWRALFEGIIRVIIFISYMAAVSLMKDMRRLFQYHGAEHKSIFCYEAGEELTPENVRKQIRFHPRCGTNFIFVTIILSILVSSIVAAVFSGTAVTTVRPLWILIKLLILPIIMSLGYEFIRYAGCHDNLFVRILAAPGLWMQRITTKEPDDAILEVGIASLKVALGLEAPNEGENETAERVIEDPADDDRS